jgi:hypothetical protein
MMGVAAAFLTLMLSTTSAFRSIVGHNLSLSQSTMEWSSM